MGCDETASSHSPASAGSSTQRLSYFLSLSRIPGGIDLRRIPDPGRTDSAGTIRSFDPGIFLSCLVWSVLSRGHRFCLVSTALLYRQTK